MKDPAAARRAARLRFVLRLLGSAAVLALLLLFVPLAELAAALGRVPVHVWLIALAVYPLLHLIGIAKWRILINAAGAGLSYAQVARCYYYGLFGNLFLPSIIGGDAVRAGLALRMARSKSGLLLGSLVDRFIDIAGLAGVAAIGALLLPSALDARSRGIFLGLAALLAVAGLGALAAWHLVAARRLPYRFRRRLVGVRRAVRTLRRRRGSLLASLLMGMALQSLLVALNAWLGDSVGIHISLVVWLFVWPLAKIAAVLPLTQGGIGVREGALVLLFQPFGVSAAAAMATGLIFTAVVVFGGLTGGLIAWVMGRRAEALPPGLPATPPA
jgi:uncharacterized protein (TIRG00374 family)